MNARPLSLASMQRALGDGWRLANATRGVSIAYSAVFVLGGVAIIGGLLARGWAPFVLAAAGAFMLVGPAILAGFFGIAAAYEAGGAVGMAAVAAGFARASRALWALALVCGLLFMIFVTDAAILYAYMVGDTPVWLAAAMPAGDGVSRFVLWSAVSGAFVAFLLYTVSSFAVPLLCERRAGLVEAVVSSVKMVLGNFVPALLWGLLLAGLTIASVLLLPLLPVTLPWLAYASRALYRDVMPV
ncbi:DUF2189 domain-containing protein [Dechloromonas sp. XY25]|uniref:DUF2189 domain-containing protein n=1 Tax=Dechloromonas hankyongensis TaxID=2908002 RepID=A0ABS9K4C1_9RHOO|nr:DUF2189 domain-containing protein [Dechloromonas hankyongensis]MCG2577986.1 DUF2189 domain-containing protein [Dechloromonas hankyongensis]